MIISIEKWPFIVQVLRYQPLQAYTPHYDYFDPAEADTRADTRAAGQKRTGKTRSAVVTLFIDDVSTENRKFSMDCIAILM